RDIYRIIQQPTGSREIWHQVVAAGILLANLTIDNTDSTFDRVKRIMCPHGHQLEEVIGSKELRREQSLRLQSSDKFNNTTHWRKLSEAGVLDGAALIKLRDTHITKDVQKRGFPGSWEKNPKYPSACSESSYEGLVPTSYHDFLTSCTQNLQAYSCAEKHYYYFRDTSFTGNRFRGGF
ncbi:hypothetical protein HOY80DRAFT_1114768, partial [Tuber brumale]